MITIRLIDARHGLSCKCRELFKNERIANEIYGYLCDGLEECENVEPEQKKGKWIKNENRSGWHCSCCGKDDFYAYLYDENNELELQDFFCPNCGADMRGEEE